jgi:protein-S-isoprenylcysteine O-methyltransferase Ste14
MNAGAPAYGLWTLVVINAAVFIIFAFSSTRPRTSRIGAPSAPSRPSWWALFTEMYGFPLTIYLLAGWLGSRYPALDLLAHNSGHPWETLPGWQSGPHLNPLHLLSNLLLGAGFILLAAWDVLYQAQGTRRLAMTGAYAALRHPQCVAFMVIMLGFLLQWPTILTLVMFPILVTTYVRLARREEREALAIFGAAHARYAAATPAFLPRLGRLVPRGEGP